MTTSDKPRRVTIADVQDQLKCVYADRRHEFQLNGTRIGGRVEYGGRAGRRGNVSTQTIYASRIYGFGVTIEETAGTSQALLGKVARRIAKAMRDGVWTGPVLSNIQDAS